MCTQLTSSVRLTLRWAARCGNERVWLNRLGGTVSKPMAAKLAAILTVCQNVRWGLYPVILNQISEWMNFHCTINQQTIHKHCSPVVQITYLLVFFFNDGWVSSFFPGMKWKFTPSFCFCTPSRVCVCFSLPVFLGVWFQNTSPSERRERKEVKKEYRVFCWCCRYWYT